MKLFITDAVLNLDKADSWLEPKNVLINARMSSFLKLNMFT